MFSCSKDAPPQSDPNLKPKRVSCRYATYPARQLNRSACQADFTDTMVLGVVRIQDTGKGKKSVAEDLEAVLIKIEDRHRGSIVR